MKSLFNRSNTSLFNFLILCSFITLFVIGCKPEEMPEPMPEPEPDPCEETINSGEWNYDSVGGTSCWNYVCSHSQQFCDGSRQSPVNLTGWVENTNLPSLSINPSSSDLHITNNGHTLQFNLKPGSFSTYGKTTGGLFNDYTLGQFHFHTNSEHQVNGAYADMEAHFVHRSIWDDDETSQYLVISIMFEKGSENPTLAKFVDNLPADKSTPDYKDESFSFNPYELLPTDRSYYTYEGSLTTPPCSETVTWIVMENKIQASEAQLEKFASILGDNFRPIQELGIREISYVKQ